MSHAPAQPELHGVAAQFADSGSLIKAAKKAYDKGYREMDAYSPIPVHGLPEAIGCKKSKVPMLTFIGGFGGAIGGFAMQAFLSTHAYPLEVAGRPFLTWPAFIPITFECGILLGGLATCFGMFALNGLPRPHHPIFNCEGFDRASCDKFFLCIESTDRRFDKNEVTAFLEGLSPENVAEVSND